MIIKVVNQMVNQRKPVKTKTWKILNPKLKSTQRILVIRVMMRKKTRLSMISQKALKRWTTKRSMMTVATTRSKPMIKLAETTRRLWKALTTRQAKSKRTTSKQTSSEETRTKT